MAGCAGAAVAGAAAVLDFFGRIGLRSFGGGAVGLSSANTGLGSMMVAGGEAKSPVQIIGPITTIKSNS